MALIEIVLRIYFLRLDINKLYQVSRSMRTSRGASVHVICFKCTGSNIVSKNLSVFVASV